MTEIITIEGCSFDLGGLVNLSFNYNFDILKNAIELIIRSQKNQAIKHTQLEESLKIKDKKLEDLDRQVYSLKKELDKEKEDTRSFKEQQNSFNQMNLSPKINGLNDLNGPADSDRLNRFYLAEDQEEKEDKNGSSSNEIRNLNYKYLRETNLIKEKLSQIEMKINDNYSNNDKEKKEDRNSSLNMKQEIDYVIDKINIFEKNIEDLNNKILDFNIYDIFKSSVSDPSKTNSNLDHTVLLVQNLDQKTMKKFESYDDKIKKNADELYKLRNEISSIKNISLKTQETQDNFIMEEKKKSVIPHIDNNEEYIREFDKKLNELNINLTSKINEIMNLNVTEELQKTSSRKIEEKDVLNKSFVSENDTKQIKELQKKVSDLEKSLKVVISSIDKNHIYEQIRVVSDKVDLKMDVADFKEYKDIISQNTHQTLFLTESLNQVLEDRKLLEDFNVIKKRVENLTNLFANFKHGDLHESIPSKSTQFDYSKYLENVIFLEFQKQLNRELENIRIRVEETKRVTDDIIADMKTAVRENDLKNFEYITHAKLEEMKIVLTKKFADKNEMVKNYKYLETEIKHFVDLYTKKFSDRSENWLLAKKPVGNFTCASCENYIGDLQDKNQFVPWNKVPVRDQAERLYRIGNGFSRMLQLINFDSNQSKSKDSKDLEGEASQTAKLGRIRSNRQKRGKENDSISFEQEYVKTDINAIDEEYKPKVVKIYKKINKQGD